MGTERHRMAPFDSARQPLAIRRVVETSRGAPPGADGSCEYFRRSDGQRQTVPTHLHLSTNGKKSGEKREKSPELTSPSAAAKW